MEARPRRVVHYVSSDDNCPFEDWMESAEGSKVHAIILQRIDRVEKGTFGKWKSVGKGVSELVIDFGPGYRVYFGQDGNDVVLLCIGDKSTQGRDIKTAQQYWGDYNA